MRRLRTLITLAALAPLGACSLRHEPALSLDHPANPQAAAAPMPARSDTLMVRAPLIDPASATMPHSGAGDAASPPDHSQHHGMSHPMHAAPPASQPAAERQP